MFKALQSTFSIQLLQTKGSNKLRTGSYQIYPDLSSKQKFTNFVFWLVAFDYK